MSIVPTHAAISMLALVLLPTIAVGATLYVPHVRVRHSALEPFLREAVERSATTRAMVATLDASDVLVYLELLPGLRDSLPAGLAYAGSGGRFRYLRISLNPSNTGAEMIAMIGHELQHAVEIATAPDVRSTRDLERFYKRIGLEGRHGETWDTEAARVAGRVVAREVARSRRSDDRR
jgi:hypothetical protein